MNEQGTQTNPVLNYSENSRLDILELFLCLADDSCTKIEDILMSFLERILIRNPENADDIENDFSTIHMLNNSFDKIYNQWCEHNGLQTKSVRNHSGNELLLSSCPNRKEVRNLLWGMYTYLEGDYPPPYEELVKEFEAYKRLRKINETT